MNINSDSILDVRDKLKSEIIKPARNVSADNSDKSLQKTNFPNEPLSRHTYIDKIGAYRYDEDCRQT